MPKNMTNIDIREYEGGDFAKIEDNYTDRQVQVAIANRAEKLIERIKTLENNPDVVDIVATYADLQAYDTTSLTDKDIIRVLEDSTHEGNSTYYRWNATTNQFDFVGEISGGGGVDSGKAKILTVDDYNANSNDWSDTDPSNFNCVALWRCDPGMYVFQDPANVTAYCAPGVAAENSEGMYLVNTTQSLTGYRGILRKLVNSPEINYYMVNTNSDTFVSLRTFADINTSLEMVKANIINTNSYNSAPTASDYGEKGQVWVYVDTNSEPHIYVCAGTDWEQSPAVTTWVELPSGTTYTAGDSIDITNDIISATNTGKARVLTTADYNYPTSNPDSVALWLLDAGTYTITDSNVYVRISSAFGSRLAEGALATVSATDSTNNRKTIIVSSASSSPIQKSTINLSTGAMVGLTESLITRVRDTLTSTETGDALSANQGKVLNDKIGDLSTLTTTDKTSAVAAINEIAAGGGGPTVVQTTGDSQTDVMSQNAVTSMVYADLTTRHKIKIGLNATAGGSSPVVVGWNSSGAGNKSVALGTAANANADGSVALGANTTASMQGEIAVGPSQTNMGYNNSNYRLLTGLYDGQSAHDAATVAQGNTLATSAPTTSTVGVLGQLYTDTTNMHTYQCTAIDDVTDPSNPVYTWTQRW